MELLEQMRAYGHENLILCSDKKTNLKALIAIHDTTLGPAMGGTRMFPYESEESAITDALRLSTAMTLKNSAAELNFGGGKAVIIGDPAKFKTPELLRSYGKFVDSLSGKYITAGDVGITADDLVQIREETKWVRGLPVSSGGSGESSTLTAIGVLYGIKACAKQVFGSDSLSGRVIAIQGLGKCGYYLAELLNNEGAELIVSDIDATLTKKAVDELGASAVEPDQIYDVTCDVFSPCALGAVLSGRTIPRLKCKIIAGAANNQLADECRDSIELEKRGTMYAPDYIVNAGGAINIFLESGGYDGEAARARVSKIYNTVEKVIAMAKSEGIQTVTAARYLAEERIENMRRKQAYREETSKKSVTGLAAL